jgi:hypothetical protein
VLNHWKCHKKLYSFYLIDDDDATGPSIPAAFRTKNWPADSEEVRPYLQNLIEEKNYIVLPLIAFDVDGVAIKPAQYESRLRGAVVQMRFSLKHWPISNKMEKNKTKHVFAADIEHIRVLVPPLSSPSKGKGKRTFSLRDTITSTPDLSPSKKPRVD